MALRTPTKQLLKLPIVTVQFLKPGEWVTSVVIPNNTNMELSCMYLKPKFIGTYRN